MLCADLLQFRVFFEEWRVGAEVDANVSVLLIGALIEERAEAGDTHQARLADPAPN